MRIAIVTGGTAGDVVPFVAIAKGLRKAGYDVVLGTSPDYRELVEAHGVTYAQVGTSFRALIETELGRRWNSTEKLGEYAKTSRELFVPLQRRVSEDATAVASDADALLFMAMFPNAFHVADKRGIPAAMLPMVPWLPSAEIPPGFMINAPSWGWLRRWLVDKSFELVCKHFKGEHDAYRATLGLPPWRHTNYYRDILGAGVPCWHLYSPTFVPRPADWPDAAEVMGFCHLEGQDADWTPSPELEAFMAAGEKPVYVGFGSTTGDKPELLAPIVLGAIEKLGIRALVAGGWCGIGGGAERRVSDAVYTLPYVPHGWAFSRVAAVVHHGSTGTFSASLRAGVPTLTVPFFGDQPFWGLRAQLLGVGPKPVRRRKLTVDSLAAAIAETMGNPAYRSAAARVAERLAAEDGVANTVAHVERLVAKAPRARSGGGADHLRVELSVQQPSA